MTSLKSCNLLLKTNIDDTTILDFIIKIHENIANYLKYLNKNNSANLIDISIWRQMTNKKVKLYSNKLFKESNAKFRRFNYNIMYFYAKIVHVSL